MITFNAADHKEVTSIQFMVFVFVSSIVLGTSQSLLTELWCVSPFELRRVILGCNLAVTSRSTRNIL